MWKCQMCTSEVKSLHVKVKEPAAVFERLHQSSRSKEALDNQQQKKIDTNKFDAQDEYPKGVHERTERP